VGSSPTDFGEASTMFGLIKLYLWISTTNNPPRRKDLGESPRIHQAFHRKFTVQQGKPGPGPHVHSTARSGAVSCRGIGSWGDASDVTGVRMGFNTRVVIHDLDELCYPIWINPHISSLKSNMKNRKADWNHTIEICRVM
jgi:hypothetical protein